MGENSMAKLTTSDIQKFLATNSEIQRLVQEDRCGMRPDGSFEDEDSESPYKKWVEDAKNPKKWVRQRKYKVGSEMDMDVGLRLGEGFSSLSPEDRPPDLTDGIVREFWLRDTDHITILTVEKDGKIVFTEDLSD